MRVLVVTHLALPHVGGVEVLVDREIRALIEAGHEVVLLTSDGDGDGSRPDHPSLRMIRIPAWHELEHRFQLPYPLFSPRLFPVLWREIGRVDVVRVHAFMFMNTAPAVWTSWVRGTPCVLTEHGGIQQFESSWTTWGDCLAAHTIGRLSARLATRLVTYNARVLQLLKRLGGKSADVQFLANPVDDALFHPTTSERRAQIRQRLGWTPDRPKVLFVGRLNRDKGVHLLLEAADSSFDLVFCGPGDVDMLGLPRDGVEYLPPRPQRELVGLYHAADLLALPSKREGFPVVVQEALACGLPVVMTEDDGYEPYRCLADLHFFARDPEAIRVAIQTALSRTRKASKSNTEAEQALVPNFHDWLQRLYGSFEIETDARAAPLVTECSSR